MFFKRKSVSRLGVVAIFFMGSAWQDAWAQDEEITFSAEYVEIVKKDLPEWTDQVLKAPDKKVWTNKTSVQAVAKAVNDEVAQQAVKDKKTSQYKDRERKLKIDRSRGYIRYINQNRAYRHTVSPKEPFDKKKAEEILLKASGAIGLPVDEFLKARVDTVVGQGGLTSTKKLEKIFRERLITVKRQINDLPVSGSMLRAAVSNKGDVARLLVRWPDFRLSDQRKLREREAVVQEIVKRIEKQAKGRKVSVNMTLNYIPRPKTKEIEYMPGIVVAVLPAEVTGFIFSVPIVE